MPVTSILADTTIGDPEGDAASLVVTGDVTVNGKLTVDGDIDPPTVTFDPSVTPPPRPPRGKARLWFHLPTGTLRMTVSSGEVYVFTPMRAQDVDKGIARTLAENGVKPKAPAPKPEPEPEGIDWHGVALHEAGHAVAAHLLGVPFKTASIGADPEKTRGMPTRGRVHLAARLDTKTPRARTTSAVMALGGLAADVLSRGTDNVEDFIANEVSTSGDWGRVRGLMRQNYAASLSCFWQAVKLLQQPKAWAAVEVVAAELLERKALTAKQVAEIVEGVNRGKAPPFIVKE